MKILFKWCCDPYLHVFAVGLILVRLSMGVGDEKFERPSEPITCPVCRRAHDPEDTHPRVVAKVFRASRGD